jgi:tRNA(adenine34) deaminase
MGLAIAEAETAGEQGEIPVGAVVVRDGQVLAAAGNTREAGHDPSGHAEITALRLAAARLGDWRLSGCTVYVTLEPCPMCVAAMRQARIDLLIWGAPDPLSGACGSVIDLAEDPRLGPPLAHRGHLAADRCSNMLKVFFAKRRASS